MSFEKVELLLQITKGTLKTALTKVNPPRPANAVAGEILRE